MKIEANTNIMGVDVRLFGDFDMVGTLEKLLVEWEIEQHKRLHQEVLENELNENRDEYGNK